MSSRPFPASAAVSKAVRGDWPLEGSNPSASAFQAAPGTHPLPGAATNGFPYRCNQFTEIQTVDHDVSAILRKLDVRTRGEASAEAARLGLAAQDR
jgi:hypothetical protein